MMRACPRMGCDEIGYPKHRPCVALMSPQGGLCLLSNHLTKDTVCVCGGIAIDDLRTLSVSV